MKMDNEQTTVYRWNDQQTTLRGVVYAEREGEQHEESGDEFTEGLHSVLRFVGDFWYSPRAALRRYSKRRTWPTSDELDRMSPGDFEAHMRSIGMLSDPSAGEARESTGGVLTGIPVGEGQAQFTTAS